MKTYEKPKLIALSLSGNNMLCNSCDVDVIGTNAKFPGLLDMIQDEYNSTAVFAQDECNTPVDSNIYYYCKFTAPDNNMPTLINS